MKYSNDQYLKFKIFELTNHINLQQTKMEESIAYNKTKEENYKDIITYLQKTNIKLLQTIIDIMNHKL